MVIADSRKPQRAIINYTYNIYNIQMRHSYILNITKNYQIYKNLIVS
jgi:hypothetical protein